MDIPVSFPVLALCAVSVPFATAAAGAVCGLGLRRSAYCGLLAGAAFAALGAAGALFAAGAGFGSADTFPQGSLRLALRGFCAIPACIVLNIAMLFSRTTRTINLNPASFISCAVVYSMASIAGAGPAWSMAAALALFAVTLAAADIASQRMAAFAPHLRGLSFPAPFFLSAVPFAAVSDFLARRLSAPRNTQSAPGDEENSRLASAGIAFAAGCIVRLSCGASASCARLCLETALCGTAAAGGTILFPRVSMLFIEAYAPVAEALRSFLAKKCNNPGALLVGIHPAAGAGHRSVALCAASAAAAVAVLRALARCDCVCRISPCAFFIAFAAAVPFTRGKFVRTLAAGLAVLCFSWLCAGNVASMLRPAPASAQEQTRAGDTAGRKTEPLAEKTAPEPGEREFAADTAVRLAAQAEADARREDASEARAERMMWMKRFNMLKRISGRAIPPALLFETVDGLLSAEYKLLAESLRAAETAQTAVPETPPDTAAETPPAGKAPPEPERAAGEEEREIHTAPASPLGWIALRTAAAGGWFSVFISAFALFVLLYADRCAITGSARILRRRPAAHGEKQEELF